VVRNQLILTLLFADVLEIWLFTSNVLQTSYKVLQKLSNIVPMEYKYLSQTKAILFKQGGKLEDK
jgi:hypothetical protein